MAAQRIGRAIEAVAHASVDALNTGGGEGFDHLVATVRVIIFSSDQVHCFDGYRQFAAEPGMGEGDQRWGGTRRFPSSRLLRRRLPIFATENESLAMDGKDHRRLMRPIDLAPKTAHMHVHEVGLWNELVLPHLSEEHFTRKYPALATHHILEHAELSR